MKRFNPDRELRKIQSGNRNKIIFGVIAFLLIISVGSTYALYQVRYSKRIIYTKVAPFSTHDIDLAVYLDGTPQTKVPEKGTAYYDSVTCDNDSKAYASWDYDNWRLKELNVSVPNKCNLNFTKDYRDASGANPPKLYQGLIPVTIDTSGIVKVANTSSKWYDYDAKEWANAVLVSNTDYATYNNKFETTIPIDKILQMYVWIPRYKYQLFNVSGASISPKEIEIKFEHGTLGTGIVTCTINEKGQETCENAENGNWFTHPAFKFGNTELTGIWVGKFETSGQLTDIKILPNMNVITSQSVSAMFTASRNIEEQYANNFNLNKDEIDIHMMKNMEWGAMAYLTQSKYGRCTNGNCIEVSRNNQANKSGYASQSWETTNGINASSTGNIYGVYDINGGAWEYVMGVMADTTGNDIYYSNSEFKTDTKPEKKYYNLYEYSSSDSSNKRGHLGDTIKETTGWYGDYSLIPRAASSWFLFSGRAGSAGGDAGIFAFTQNTGGPYNVGSFRIVITTQDGSS